MASSDVGTLMRSEYQVFLSFEGSDSCIGFTNFLYHDMTDLGITVFRDDEDLRLGEKIDGLLPQAIDNCRIYIPIFSYTYASSEKCLRELTQIISNTKKFEDEKMILPIFFGVEPDDVKLKTSLYCDSIRSLKLEKKLSSEQVDAWKDALAEVGKIKGWVMRKDQSQAQVVKMIVEVVLEKLKTIYRLVTGHLVGIDDHVTAISKLLDIESGNVQLIGIYGMGGIGKSTLARVVFKQFSSHFEKCCFLPDVQVKSSSTNGLVELQKKLLFEIGHPIGTRSIDEIDHNMKVIEEILQTMKVLLVLDDVGCSEQVEILVGKSMLHFGSRILITTRNKDVLRMNEPKYHISSYELKEMTFDLALELFSWHAFNRRYPSKSFICFARDIVAILGGLPLALIVIGSLLHNKTVELWTATLHQLREIPHDDVFRRLMISYEALTFEQQQIFLDIACFFIGEDKTNAIYMWRNCEFSPDTGVNVLINMSLVRVLGENKFWMHDQLRDLGREIVRQENPLNPNERSRIWRYEKILDAIGTNKMNDVQALSLDSYARSFDDGIVLSRDIGIFEHLRFLKLHGGTFAGDLANCLPNLSWICWYFPPRKREWTNMHLKNIIVIEFTGVDLLDDSKLQDLIKRARKLKVLSLKSCHKITGISNFSGCPNLERLTFEDCSKLSRIDGSIGGLASLIYLKIDSCFCLKDLPEEMEDLADLEHLFVQQCNVKRLPDSVCKLKSLRELHFSSRPLPPVSADFWLIPSAIGTLQNLEVLSVNSLNLKGKLPSGIGELHFLRILDLSNTHVSEIPETISRLTRLEILELMGCHNIQELPVLPTSLTHLRVSSASLQGIPNLSDLTKLVQLDLMIVDEEEINCLDE